MRGILGKFQIALFPSDQGPETVQLSLWKSGMWQVNSKSWNTIFYLCFPHFPVCQSEPSPWLEGVLRSLQLEPQITINQSVLRYCDLCSKSLSVRRKDGGRRGRGVEREAGHRSPEVGGRRAAGGPCREAQGRGRGSSVAPAVLCGAAQPGTPAAFVRGAEPHPSILGGPSGSPLCTGCQ